MKATSKATLACLEQCLQILHQKVSFAAISNIRNLFLVISNNKTQH